MRSAIDGEILAFRRPGVSGWRAGWTRGDAVATWLCKTPEGRSRFGDAILIMFLLAQVLDGAFTYVGVLTFGRAIEANPLLHWLMGTVGEGPAVTSAKLLAGSCGIALHLTAVHRVVALLTLFYLTAAVLPWASILFF